MPTNLGLVSGALPGKILPGTKTAGSAEKTNPNTNIKRSKNID
jgi:hypothetical protein